MVPQMDGTHHITRDARVHEQGIQTRKDGARNGASHDDGKRSLWKQWCMFPLHPPRSNRRRWEEDCLLHCCSLHGKGPRQKPWCSAQGSNKEATCPSGLLVAIDDPYSMERIRPSSSFANVARCTSSGPSAIRSVRAAAHRLGKIVSWQTPAPPWTCIA